MVQLSYRIEGGLAHFPGLARETTLDTDDLPADDAKRLLSLLESAQVAAAQGRAAPRQGAADYQTYKITVPGIRDQPPLILTDAAPDRAVRELLELLRAHRPGPG